MKVYQLVLKSKSQKILVLEKLSSQELVLQVPKKKPSSLTIAFSYKNYSFRILA